MNLPTFVPARLNWFEEDLALLRQQRSELDARIQTLESRVAALRVYAGQSASDSPTIESARQPANVAPTEAVAAPVAAPVSIAAEPLRGSVSADVVAEPVPAAFNVVPATPPAPRRSIMSLGLETRTHNALMNNDIKSFAQLVTMTPNQLRALNGFGAGSLSDLESALARVGESLAPEQRTRRKRTTQFNNEQQFSGNSVAAGTRSDGNQSTGSHSGDSRSDGENSDRTRSGASSDAYEGIITVPYQFGVIHAEDLQKMLNVGEAESKNLLEGDSRWTDANGGWYLRAKLPQSWIARRVLEVLNAVKRVGVEALYQSVKRIATRKFVDEGWRMPSRALLGRIVESLRTEGVHFDIVHEVAHIDGTLEMREMSGTSKAVLQAFGGSIRALSGADVSAAIQASGMSEASAQLALGSSPLVVKLERGIYGLVGRTATLRDIANARTRPGQSNGVVARMNGEVEELG